MQAQQHAFNTPLQLGAFMEDGNQFDQPEDADVYRLQLQAGDVVVLATDGILDNMCALAAAASLGWVHAAWSLRLMRQHHGSW